MGIELRDNKGLICGFCLQPQGRADEIEISAIDAQEPHQLPLWLHFNLNDTRARNWIANCVWLSQYSREALLSNNHSIHLESVGNGIAGALADVYTDDPTQFGDLHFYVDQNCLITGRRHSVAAISILREDLANGVPMGSSSLLFNRLLSHLVATRAKLVAEYAELIDDAEDRVFAGEYSETKLGQHRRKMARLRRQLVSDRHPLIDLSAHPPSNWHKPAIKELRHIARALTSVWQDLELVEERARLLNEEIDSRLVERTNRNLYFISVAAAVFLPVTLISGIFGMNVGGLPWLDDAGGFLWAIGCMVTAVALAFAVMYWRGML